LPRRAAFGPFGEAARADARSARATSRGIALIWALFASMIVAGIIVAGSGTQRAVDKMGDASFSAEGQARAVAEAGLIDGLAWFRRQQSQPVTTFAPARNLLANPVINETDDTTIGLVREYEIMPSLWGRYELKKPVAAETWTDTNTNGRYDYGETFTDTNANGKRDPARELRDVTAERGLAGSGTVWRLVSHGYVFRRPDPAQALGAGPNTRLSGVVVAAEIRRFLMVPPAVSAICVKTASGVTLGARTRIMGGTKGGVITLASTGLMNTTGGPEITGTPATGTVPSYDDSVSTVFGVTLAELKAMADASWSTAAAFPKKIGDYTLNVVPGPIVFDDARPLRGTGIVVVDGDCSLVAGNNSFYNGFLYVKGNLTVRGPVYMRGTVVATGTVDMAGTGGDYTEVDYDANILTTVLTMLGQYRFSTASYEPSNALRDGVPDEENLIYLQHTGKVLPGTALPVQLEKSLP
jgi:hypothetical protein